MKKFQKDQKIIAVFLSGFAHILIHFTHSCIRVCMYIYTNTHAFINTCVHVTDYPARSNQLLILSISTSLSSKQHLYITLPSDFESFRALKEKYSWTAYFYCFSLLQNCICFRM